MLVQPYLFFNGRCEEALEFYKKAIGAKVTMMMRFKESPEPPSADCGPIPPDSIMHANFSVGDTQVMASDGMATGGTDFKGFSLSLTAANDVEAERMFKALSEGGKVTMPITKTFYASSFGMLTDRFGVAWMVIMPLPMP